MHRLDGLGFLDIKRSHYHLADVKHQDFTLAGPREWLDFLNHRVPELEAAGYEIHVEEKFPYRLANTSGRFDAEFEGSGIDWFELNLGVEIDGQRQDLTGAVAALVRAPEFKVLDIESLAAEGRDLYLPLDDGRHIAVAAERFLPVILALHSLNLAGVFVGDNGRLRVSRAEVATLLDFESGDFVFRGADGLRRMAGLLHADGLTPMAPPPGFCADLRPYQAMGLAWLDLLRDSGLGGILADDMGLGKTVQILALLAAEKAAGRQAAPNLIVAPTSLMTNWCNEAARFAPALRVLLLHGSERKQDFAAIAEHDVVLTTYPLVARDHEILLDRDWYVAVLDEAQTIKNPAAATTKWLRGVKAQHRFCLTGTPMENHLGELWSLMSFVNPGFLGERAAFTRTWRTPIEKRGDLVRSQALARRVKPFLLRRTKSEVAGDLPPKTEIVETVQLEGRQRDLYDSIRLSMAKKVRQAIAERGLAKSHIIVLDALLKLRQVCCDPRLLKLADK
ncbi:MAG: DEAD/DEAH box helicase, partial [Asticcacaulis sp.]|nr:DEAD/DEAH box helicase [Asticcacaulis sp.]